MKAILARALVVSGLALAHVACGGAPEEEAGVTSEAESALVSVPSGTFTIGRAPSSGSYIKRLTLKARKKFELEYVKVSSRSEPWLWNPWIQVPSRDEESMLLEGSYFTFAGDGDETLISFDMNGGSIDHLIYSIERDGDSLRLEAVGQRAFVLEPGGSSEPAIDKRVASCSNSRFSAKIKFEDAERRRGTFTVKRKANADENDPQNGTFDVIYNGNTGVEDYMGFDGQDDAGGRYEFAMKRSDLDKTSGPIANIGLGYAEPDRSYYVHRTLTCTIGTR